MKEAFNKYFVDILKNHYLDFQGKIDNKTFSFFFLNWFIVYFFVVAIFFIIHLLPVIFNTDINFGLLALPMVIMVIIAIYLLVPCFCACVRRQRDISEKYWFWFFFLILIPLVGNFIYVAVLCILPSEKEQKNNKQIE